MRKKQLTKADWKKLEKDLCRVREHLWPQLKAKETKEAFLLGDRYKHFLTQAKTEREAVIFIQNEALKNGFVPMEKAKRGSRRFIWTFRGKVAALAVLGSRPIDRGIRLIASHIDVPRLDLKLNPLYEELEMAYLKTHYYGGIKKFHWLSRALAIHGVVLKQDGRVVVLRVGEDADDPVLTINDLLPHLASKVQGDKKISEAIPAEKLNVLVGGIPLAGPEGAQQQVKIGILKLLHDKYGIKEEDFVSAELEIVPAGPARDVGLDRAFVGGYGQDDRICGFCSLEALLGLDRPAETAVALFVDKEEIGSDGNTGAKSRLFDLIIFDLLRHADIPVEADTLLRLLVRSKGISADVTAGIDPDYQEVHEKLNDALMGHGICLTKYTGSRGKYSANDAHAEYMNWLRRTWNEAGVIWQAGELGKVDEGGGGTVAKYLAQQGMDIVDAGPPVLSMHSPFEVAHKADLYMSTKAFGAFFNAD